MKFNSVSGNWDIIKVEPKSWNRYTSLKISQKRSKVRRTKIYSSSSDSNFKNLFCEFQALAENSRFWMDLVSRSWEKVKLIKLTLKSTLKNETTVVNKCEHQPKVSSWFGKKHRAIPSKSNSYWVLFFSSSSCLIFLQSTRDLVSYLTFSRGQWRTVIYIWKLADVFLTSYCQVVLWFNGTYFNWQFSLARFQVLTVNTPSDVLSSWI